VGFEVGRINHHGLLFAVVSRQTGHHPGEDALVAPSLPAVVQGLVRTVLLGCVPPSQAIAIDEDNPAQNPSIINTGLAMGPGEKGLKTRHLGVTQPEKVRHVHRSFSNREPCCSPKINGS